MDTKVMEQIYQKVAEIVNDIIPEDWDKVYLYAEVSEDMREVYFYYYPEGEKVPVYSLDIVKISDIDEDDFDDMSSELEECFEELWEEFKRNKQDVWTSLTLMLESTGKFKIEYDYEDLSEADDYEKHIIWKYKYLGIEPSPDKKREKKILDNYLKQLEDKK